MQNFQSSNHCFIKQWPCLSLFIGYLFCNIETKKERSYAILLQNSIAAILFLYNSLLN